MKLLYVLFSHAVVDTVVGPLIEKLVVFVDGLLKNISNCLDLLLCALFELFYKLGLNCADLFAHDLVQSLFKHNCVVFRFFLAPIWYYPHLLQHSHSLAHSCAHKAFEDAQHDICDICILLEFVQNGLQSEPAALIFHLCQSVDSRAPLYDG